MCLNFFIVMIKLNGWTVASYEWIENISWDEICPGEDTVKIVEMTTNDLK